MLKKLVLTTFAIMLISRAAITANLSADSNSTIPLSSEIGDSEGSLTSRTSVDSLVPELSAIEEPKTDPDINPNLDLDTFRSVGGN
ncbi:hypothetical protein J23TS9_54170 [Paenibacillus sp. J23TS9]|uniref:hypothetical protein n=1 Tax=Paenibacillus sp. J23TS9 TaxID=2807193 RepID=UPI001B0030C4|nr:hypothetical protein [Paenibacillus sp. J23TS9]GIP30287.1 hypothetical protein J23TS9_54170 [Paenibacillus sp. J23TS9]